MKKRIITISRQFGSGGSTVGKNLAQQLGIKFYNRELVEHIAAESGLSREFILKNTDHSEAAGFLRYLYGKPVNSVAMNGLSTEDFLWLSQCKVISELGDKAPCVIVGRNADYILRNRQDVLNVFVYADADFRAKRISRIYGISAKAAEKRINDTDKQRKNYYKQYSGNEWGASSNYDICLSSSQLGIDLCTKILVQCVESSI